MIYSIIDKPQALLPAKNEIMHEFEFSVPLLYKYPYMCVISTSLLYLLVHDVVSILYMILCLFFFKKRKEKNEREKQWKKQKTKQKEWKKKKKKKMVECGRL